MASLSFRRKAVEGTDSFCVEDMTLAVMRCRLVNMPVLTSAKPVMDCSRFFSE